MYARQSREMARYAKLLYERRYCAGTEGNLSLRLGEGRFLITPSKRLKAFLGPRDMILTDSQGNKLCGRGNPTTERFTHLTIYAECPQARAVIHAHTLFSTLAAALGDNPFERPFLAEAAMFFSKVRIAPFALPSTREGAEAVRGLAAGADAIVADRHGVFVWGATLEEAFSKLDSLEKIAEADYFARLSGREIKYLDESVIERLRKVPY